MNYYFLLEDEKSFYKILPQWLNFLDFGCTQVMNIQKVVKNNYIIESGHGITQLETKIIFDTINTLIDIPNIIDKLIIIVDSEDIGVQNRKKRIYDKINNYYQDVDFTFSIEIFVCNICIESWFLGSRGMYPKSNDVHNCFSNYHKFYNIENDDPELMRAPSNYNKSIASYHFQYLHYLTQNMAFQKHERALIYRKNIPGYILHHTHFRGLLDRINVTNDMSSFRAFYNFIMLERLSNKKTPL